ncbi:MAG: heparinase, partial [Planctomycetes bacterium]|nr:heparinase [Planctomycetota bacterium]
IGPLSHNILTVDGQEQVVKGRATILATHGQRTVIDAGPVYRGQLQQALRGVSLLADRSVVVQDEIVAEHACTVRWAMMTRATVGGMMPGAAVLTQDGHRLVLRVLEPAGALVRTWASDPPPAAYDAANSGTVMVGFETRIEAGAALRIAVQLAPGDGGAAAVVTPLAQW